MTAQQSKKRSDAIDMVKGLSIMTLFFLHFEHGFFEFNYNFFLVRSPAFYIIVGWLWGLSQNRRSVKEHWKKRKKGLIMPYIYFSLIFIVFDLIMVVSHLMEPFALFRDIYKTLCLRGIGTLWFLPALLGGEIIFLFLRTKKLKYKLVATTIFFTILYYIWGGIHLNNSLYNDLFGAPLKVLKDILSSFLYIGAAYFISRRFGKKILAINKIKQFLIGSCLLGLDFYIMNFKIQGTNGEEFLLFFIGNIFAGIGIILVFTAIENFKLISQPLVYCGKNSLIIMAIHYGLLFQGTLIIDRAILGYNMYYGSKTVIYFIIALILQIIIIEFINRKIPFIIGK